MELLFSNECAKTGNELLESIKNFKITIDITGEKLDPNSGIIGFDFPIEAIRRLLAMRDVIGIRVLPAIDANNKMTAILTPYTYTKNEGATCYNELFVDSKLVGECCPQPPNNKSKTNLDKLVNP